jgi:hypothetical protein
MLTLSDLRIIVSALDAELTRLMALPSGGMLSDWRTVEDQIRMVARLRDKLVGW